MRIGIDGMIWGGEERGVATATRRLILEFASVCRAHELVVIVSDPRVHEQFLTSSNSNVEVVRYGRRTGVQRILWQQLGLPRLVRKLHLDILYCPCYTVPMLTGVRTVVTVHDVIASKRPDVCRAGNRLHLRLLLGPSMRRASCITVPTNSVKLDVLAEFAVSDQQVAVVPWGVDMEIAPVEPEQARRFVRGRFGIVEAYALFAGCLERKKNLATAVEACRKAGIRLVIVGPRESGQVRLEAAARQWPHEGVSQLGYVSNTELSALYSAARVFVFPSHIEGFGLPVIEAMHCGVPVVTSDAPAIREVTGGAAMHESASDPVAMARALERVLTDSVLREELSARGRERAAEFTWKRAANLFAEVLERAVR